MQHYKKIIFIINLLQLSLLNNLFQWTYLAWDAWKKW
jgi:hypothetical protein